MFRLLWCIGFLLFWFGLLAGARAAQKALVLQWEVSHSRNTDQVSLIFRPKKVELITNTSLYQKGEIVRLGRFQSPLTSKWQKIQKRVSDYHKELTQTVPLSTLIKDKRFKLHPDPHAPVLRLNGEELKEGGIYFKELEAIIRQVWEHKWSCVECAEYQRHKKNILRTVKVAKADTTNNRTKKAISKNKKNGMTVQWRTQKKAGSYKDFKCVPKETGKVECVDERFGVFEI